MEFYRGYQVEENELDSPQLHILRQAIGVERVAVQWHAV